MARIVIALSGGVDSSVAAALLKQEGHEVSGMMLRLWSEPGREDSNRCCSPDSMSLARRVAARLDIPFYVVDAKEIFRRTVVQDFLDGYAAGRTPNPCITCNKVMRWEYLLAHATDLGAEYLATGHYARLRKDENGKIQLLRSRDRTKDQSYVLHMLTQEKLGRACFPLGEYTKDEVRELAGRYNLPTADRADSQDLCFLAGEDYRDFLQRHAPETLRPGKIINRKGEVLGEHKGLARHTIGQRKGLGLAGGEPLYVLGKDTKNNTLIVGGGDEGGGWECRVEGINWIAGRAPAARLEAGVKTRYTAKMRPAEIEVVDKTRANVRFKEAVRDLAPGQAAVFYGGEAGEMVLGGGTIAE